MQQLTVSQNIFIGREYMKGKIIDDGRMNEEAGKLFEKLNDMGNTIMMITHDLNVARAAGRIVHIKMCIRDSTGTGGRVYGLH